MYTIPCSLVPSETTFFLPDSSHRWGARLPSHVQVRKIRVLHVGYHHTDLPALHTQLGMTMSETTRPENGENMFCESTVAGASNSSRISKVMNLHGSMGLFKCNLIKSIQSFKEPSSATVYRCTCLPEAIVSVDE